MRKWSPGIGRRLLVYTICLIGIFSIGFWLLAIVGFRQSPMIDKSKVAIAIPVNETIRAVWNSGLYRSDVVGARIYWVDNDTILVSANRGPKPRTPEEKRNEENWLYLWKLGEKPEPYGADPHATARSYCAAHGEITYYLEIKDVNTGVVSRTRWVGTPGEQRQMPPLTRPLDGKAAGVALAPLSIEPFDCEPYIDPAMAGKFYVTDSERLHYLDFGTDPMLASVHARPEEPIFLMRADRSERIELPISNANVSPGATYYRMFERVFYLWRSVLGKLPINHFEIWRESNCWPIWQVDPQIGKTTRICIPFGPWAGTAHGGGATSIELAPTKAGLFFATRPVKIAEEHGLYRLDSSAVSRILPGYVWSASVSPNGCRVAFIYIPNDDAFRPFSSVSSSIVAIDLCSPSPASLN